MHIVCMAIRTSSREDVIMGKATMFLHCIAKNTTYNNTFPVIFLLRFQSETTHLYDDDDSYVLTIHLPRGSTNVVMMITMVYNIVSTVHVHNFRTV